MRLQLAAVCVVALCPAVVVAQSSRHELAPDQSRWSSRLAPGGSLQVRGGFGDITVVKSEGDEFSVEIVRGNEGTVVPRVVVAENEKGAVVCADWITAAAVPSPCVTSGRMLATDAHKNYASVALKIAVPEGTTVNAQANAGSISIGPLNSSVTAQTYTGDVRVVANGERVKAQNHRGKVEVVLSPEPMKQNIHAGTIHGSIRIVLPPTRVVHYELYTRGASVSSAYPLEGGGAALRLPSSYEYRRPTSNFSGNLGPPKEKIWTRLEVFTTNGDVANIEIVQP